jgi:hypothetical protein
VHYEQASAFYRELGDRHGEAGAFTRLGDTHQAAGDTEAAELAWLQALTILDQLDHYPDADHLHTKTPTPHTRHQAGSSG